MRVTIKRHETQYTYDDVSDWHDGRAAFWMRQADGTETFVPWHATQEVVISDGTDDEEVH